MMRSATDLYLAPVPKSVVSREGVFRLAGKRFIRLDAADPALLVPAAEKIGLDWELTASPNALEYQVGLTILLDLDSDIVRDGYNLSIAPSGIEIIASTPAGAFYGASTLAQILRQCGDQIPCLSISDQPDFPARGVMLDISRDKVPTMETLYHLVDMLAEWKINQIQLYTEHTFAYLAHPAVWENASPMTGEEIMKLDAYCRERFIELVPNQNSFGHMERWLKHSEYNSLAEAPEGCETAWGFREAFSLSPIDSRSIPLVSGLYEELLPHFSSKLFNVGCDETIDLGLGRSKQACEEQGMGRVYLDFLLRIHELVKSHGRTMMFWGDIIMNHPELISELPKDVIALEWGYEADHPFGEHGKKFRESGIPFYVCPGTSSWLSFAGRTENAVENITNAARNGLQQGAIGLLNTDWGDWGHWQPLSVSYLGFMAGAMAAWNSGADLKPILAQNLSIHAFGDLTGKTGQAFYDLGDIYRVFKKKTTNSSVPFQVLFWPDRPKTFEGLEADEFDEMNRRLDEITKAFIGTEMTASDADIVHQELAHVQDLLRLSMDVGEARLNGAELKEFAARVAEIKKEHNRVWLLRNRPGGMADSADRLSAG